MKHYVVWKEEKVYLRFERSVYTRWDVVAEMRGGVAFTLSDEKGGSMFYVNDIIAEAEFGTFDCISRTLVGAFVGILLGPIGMAIGGLLGLGSHHLKHKKEKLLAEHFNRDKISFPPEELEEVV